MNFLAKFFGVVPKTEREGIDLDWRDCWFVDGVSDPCTFFRALPLLVEDAESVLYIEDTGERCVREFLAARAIEPQAKIGRDTIWPRPDVYHIPLNVDNVEALAQLIESEPVAFVCVHVKVYRDQILLLHWHDAFSNSFAVNSVIDEAHISAFAEVAGGKVERVQEESRSD